jgi:hypothetical protein
MVGGGNKGERLWCGKIWLSKYESLALTKKDVIIMKWIEHYLKYIKKKAKLTDLYMFIQSKLSPNYSRANLNYRYYDRYHIKYILMILRLRYMIKVFNIPKKTGIGGYNLYEWRKGK